MKKKKNVEKGFWIDWAYLLGKQQIVLLENIGVSHLLENLKQ